MVIQQNLALNLPSNQLRTCVPPIRGCRGNSAVERAERSKNQVNGDTGLLVPRSACFSNLGRLQVFRNEFVERDFSTNERELAPRAAVAQIVRNNNCRDAIRCNGCKQQHQPLWGKQLKRYIASNQLHVHVRHVSTSQFSYMQLSVSTYITNLANSVC